MPHVDLPQAEFKVVLLGDTSAGKTSLVLRFAEGYYRDSARNPTVGAFFITKRLVVNGLTCKVQIWDTAGQEQFKPLAPMYYQNAAAAIICYDVTSPKSLDVLKYWLQELQQNVQAGQIVLAMAACKCDMLDNNNNDKNKSSNANPPPPPPPPHQSLSSCSTTSDQNMHISPDNLQQQAEELAQSMGFLYVETSAKTNTNVTDLFSRVTERVLQFQKNEGSAIPVTFCNSSTPRNTTPKGGSVTMRAFTPRGTPSSTTSNAARTSPFGGVTPRSSLGTINNSMSGTPSRLSMGSPLPPPRSSLTPTPPVPPTPPPLSSLSSSKSHAKGKIETTGVSSSNSTIMMKQQYDEKQQEPTPRGTISATITATTNAGGLKLPPKGAHGLHHGHHSLPPNPSTPPRDHHRDLEEKDGFDPTDSPIVVQEGEDNNSSGRNSDKTKGEKATNNKSSLSSNKSSSSKRSGGRGDKSGRKASSSSSGSNNVMMMCEGTTDLLSCANITVSGTDGANGQCVIL